MISQNLINELVEGYTQGRFERKYLKKKIQEVLEFIIPQISAQVKVNNEKELVPLWQKVKEEKNIRDLFKKALRTVERPILIYVVSKFTNNQSIGTRIIKEAAVWK